MANFIKITFGLAASALQPDIMQLLHAEGDQVIQTSDGLCVKSVKSLDDFKSTLKNKNLDSGIQLSPVDSQDDKLSPDIKAFLEK
jgi:hypothetical protein